MDSELPSVPPDEEFYISGKQAAADLNATASAQSDRWRWMRWLAVGIGVLAFIAAVAGIIGIMTTRDVQTAVDTSRFSEQQRAARSNRADCIRQYETDYRIADTHFDAAIVNYLAFDQGTVMDATTVLDELNGAAQRLEAIQEGKLCTKFEFGVEDTPSDTKAGGENDSRY